MYVKQLSVFLENETGRLDDVLSTISDNGINILSISLADTSDFGVLRLLVSDPDRAKTLLKEHGITSKLTDVIAVSVPHSIGSLRRVMNALSSAGIAISYVYGLSLHDDGASIVLKANDSEKALAILKEQGVTLYDQAAIVNMQ